MVVPMPMKVMKSKKVSKIANGKRAKAAVLTGRKEKTTGGLQATDLMKNFRGKTVSKKKVALGKRNFKKGLFKWNAAVKKARESLGLEGFVGIKKGSPLYAKARAFYRESA
mmetsp:Transcript_80671/g.142892  ORF Transcript_80671/g.142892 Transcript_80671/m.142892 type:complete len:111 (+) Transcript_80671:89-421(+)